MALVLLGKWDLESSAGGPLSAHGSHLGSILSSILFIIF